MSNPLQYPTGNGLIIAEFLRRYRADRAPGRHVLELGTRKWGSDSTHHKALLETWDSYVMADVEGGEDVDVVVDAHELGKRFGPEFSAFLACSVWEHLERPWVAAGEVQKVLVRGGIFFIQTHQTFPIHGYPSDYFRFTKAALVSLFPWAIDIEAGYEFPAKIVPHDSSIPWNPGAAAFLNVCITGRRP